MLRKAFLVLAAVLLLPALVSAYTVILKNGRRVEARERYVVERGVAKFVGADGKPYQIPLTEIDVPATERANAPTAPAPPPRPRRKVWTNDDVEALRGGEAVNVVGAAAPAPAATAEEGAEGEEVAAEEKAKPLPAKEDTPEYWQERLKPLREELANVEKQMQQLRTGQGKAESNAISLVAPNPGAQVEDTMRRLEKRRTDLQQQIEAVQLEAKRKGIDPGYLR